MFVGAEGDWRPETGGIWIRIGWSARGATSDTMLNGILAEERIVGMYDGAGPAILFACFERGLAGVDPCKLDDHLPAETSTTAAIAQDLLSLRLHGVLIVPCRLCR